MLNLKFKDYQSLNITILLILSFEILFIFYLLTGLNHQIEIIVTIYGGFIATLIGVYWSFHLSTQQAEADKKKERKRVLLASLKLILSELDVNEMNLKDVRQALDTMPQQVNTFYDSFTMLQTIVSSLKSQAFYGSIFSGDMREITNESKIFNAIQQAYFNMELSISAFNTVTFSFKSYSEVRDSNLSEDDKNQCQKNITNTKNNLDRLLVIVNKAKQEVKSYLENHGIKIGLDKEIINLFQQAT